MSGEVRAQVEALDDKQAIYVAQKLGAAVFTETGVPEYSQMVEALAAAAPELNVGALASDTARASTLTAGDGGAMARAVLLAWADNPDTAPAVAEAVARFRTSKQDLGILSVPLALGLTYALIAMDLNINLGFAKIAKKGLSGEQQMKVVNKTLDPLLKVLQVGRR
jgi:hypothetical protein